MDKVFIYWDNSNIFWNRRRRAGRSPNRARRCRSTWAGGFHDSIPPHRRSG